jgi:sec-independent protein translocase protein TatA
MFDFGVPEMALLLAIAFFLFGSSKLPQLGKGLGEAISGFRNALNEDRKDKIQHS